MSTQTPIRTETSPTGSAPPPPESRPGAGAIMLGLVLIAAGSLWLLAALGVEIPVSMVAPVVLITLGLAVVVAAVRGEDHAAIGLAVFIGVWVAIGAIVTAVVDVPLTGAVGDFEHAPATAAELDDGYRVFAGTQTLDLRGLELAEGTTEVVMTTVLGEVEVLVPEGMAVRVDAAVAGGALDLQGEVTDGLGLDDVSETDGWDEAPRRLDLELRVGLGEVRVGDG